MLLRYRRDERDFGGCAIAGVMNEGGRIFGCEPVMRMIANMRERSNGLGGGFAAYGIYPDRADLYAMHIMCETPGAKRAAEEVLSLRCVIRSEEPIPTRRVAAIRGAPALHRYFVSVRPDATESEDGRGTDEEDAIVETVMTINGRVEGALVFSSGRNMGVFKGVGYPEDIGEFFRLDTYRAYAWTAHGRFPTNTTGWWGGAHPFGLLDWSVVHNGEVSSYGINRRYLANYGYTCSMYTDTEVITYLFDLLLRRHRLPLEAACVALAPPFWEQIERMSDPIRQVVTTIRIVYGGALLNGPFSILVGCTNGLIALNDRTKLRPMAVARKGDMVYVASEEAAIRAACADPDVVSRATGGVPIVAALRDAVAGGRLAGSGSAIDLPKDAFLAALCAGG